MAIITLTSDAQEADFYTGVVKGEILQRLPQAHIIDITHRIAKFNVSDAGYVLGRSWRHFPDGTIHIVAVDSTQAEQPRVIASAFKGHFFIGFDNGWLNLALGTEPEKTVVIDNPLQRSSFLWRDVMVPAACRLADKEPLESLGSPLRLLNGYRHPEPNASDHQITGHILYIDAYGNAISNISAALFEEVGRGRRFTMSFHRENISTLHRHYHDVAEGELVALMNTNDHLEVAINCGSAAQLLGLQLFESISITFNE